MMHETIEAADATAVRPRSAVSAGVGLSGLAGLGLWCLYCHHAGLDGPFAALAAVLAGALPMVLWSLVVDRVHRNASTGIDWAMAPRPWREVLDTGLVKLAGLWTTWGLIALCYAVGRWYWAPPYLFAMRTLQTLVPLLLVASVPYILWIERKLVEPRDGCWQFGRLLIGQGRDDQTARAAIAGHLRAWTVKGFFTAFMISTLPGNWQAVMAIDPKPWLDDVVQLGEGLVAVMFLVDVTLATTGYLLTMRPLDSHIRSANPYVAGWTAALLCYPPMFLMYAGGPLDYHGDFRAYSVWLGGHPLLLTLDVFALIALTGIYAWATIAFGLRFSNLTNRGIITNGPYAWCRHPAYVSKNLFWWCASMPFLAASGSWLDAFRNAAILALINAIYYWRARTEERHLLADPEYVAYWAWARDNAPVTRFLRSLGRRRAAPARRSP